MIQAIGLTSVPRRNRPPVVDDLTFEARPGRVTVLLGESGAGKTSALRLMLRLDPGRGIALFRGRSLDRVAHPVREVGVLLGDVPGHPGRTARGHLRMLGAAAGVPAGRADEVLDVVGLSGLADQRIGDFSRGMDRRLGLAAALLGDPHTLVLDEPAADLSPRETSWLHGLLRGYAAQGGAVLVTSSSPGEAARVGDQVVTIHRGRLVADQEAAVFARARLRPRVAVQSPSAARLAHIISAEAEAATPPSEALPVEVVHDGGSTLAVYGSSCAVVGETAFRHGILVHRLAEETEAGPVPPLQRADGRPPADGEAAADAPAGVPSGSERRSSQGPLSRVQPPLPAPGPAWPLRYELYRATGVRTGWIVAAAALLLSLLAAVLLARAGAPEPSLLAGWPAPLPLPPAALGAGVLGALAFGQEFRYPALAPDVGSVPRRLALLGAKLVITAAAALLLALLSVALDAGAVRLLFGEPVSLLPGAWAGALAGWIALTLGCAWAGLLAAGLFRSTALGLVAVLVVPTLGVPVVGAVLAPPAARSLAGLPERLRSTALLQWPTGVDEGVSTALRLMSQPVGWALVLSLTGLLGAYVLTVVRGRPR
ncbi:ATP-binding cassette domain-containing protein [Streptomyces sp. I05A-00742]|uniref:ABC transporter ATP-binding protein n=1 Tax=Streptomyces sp. I05A-00742 TaxID=2732853 RepID=UPI00148819ED|nr:ATP-binding cassette domain-containing protein [Streptomyces sp. I05A-00742]